MAEKPQSKQQPQPGNVQIGILAIRDVLLQAIARGQLPVLLTGAVMFLMVWRMPEEAVGSLAQDMASSLADGSILGWILFGVMAIGWALQAKSQREMYEHEIARISKERDALQRRILDADIQSSKARR
ncbi:MAG: hypothetical protein GKR94_05315 [Gammaproteobacteria bacterium]|nr:hypothetical protein [Gammaproteobacteria bacterium]